MVSWGAMRVWGGVIVLDCIKKVGEGIFCLVTAEAGGRRGRGRVHQDDDDDVSYTSLL